MVSPELHRSRSLDVTLHVSNSRGGRGTESLSGSPRPRLILLLGRLVSLTSSSTLPLFIAGSGRPSALAEALPLGVGLRLAGFLGVVPFATITPPSSSTGGSAADVTLDGPRLDGGFAPRVGGGVAAARDGGFADFDGGAEPVGCGQPGVHVDVMLYPPRGAMVVVVVDARIYVVSSVDGATF